MCCICLWILGNGIAWASRCSTASFRSPASGGEEGKISAGGEECKIPASGGEKATSQGTPAGANHQRSQPLVRNAEDRPMVPFFRSTHAATEADGAEAAVDAEDLAAAGAKGG